MLQKYVLTWRNDSVGLTEQRVYEQVNSNDRVLIGTVGPNDASFTFEKDYGESAKLSFYVESVGIIDGLESRQMSLPVDYEIIPVVEPFIFIANPKNRVYYNQIVLEDHDRVEVVGHPEIQPKYLGGWLYELWLPISTDEDFEIRVYPKDNSKPLGAISFNNMLKEIVQWSSSGHKATIRQVSGYNPFFLLSTDMLTKVPAQLHPTITNLDYFFRAASIVTDITKWDVSRVTSMRGTFQGSRLAYDFRNWDVSNVTDMSDLFRSSRYNHPLNDWDVSKVTNASGMFRDNTIFNQSLNNWNTSNFTNISYMFSGAASFNNEISAWDVSNVTDASYTFNTTALFNSDITGWDTSNFVTMEGMFFNAVEFNKGIGVWNTANVTNMSKLFESANKFNFALDNWDTSKVTNMTAMFRHAWVFDQPLNHFNVSKVTNMSMMFTGAWVFNQPLDTWDVSKVTTFNQMFEAAQEFNRPLNMWNIESAVDLGNMFAYAYKFNQPLDQWDTNGVETMSGMFRDAREFNQPLNMWDMSTVVNVSYMFASAIAFNQPLNEWNTDNFLYIEGTFRDTVAFNEDISTWNISQVKSLVETFTNAVAFNGDISQWNTSIVTHMQKAFQGAISFNGDITGWDTIRVVDMSDMLNGATSFAQPIGNWRVGNVDNMDRMFKDVPAVISLGSWCVSKILTRPVLFSNHSAESEPVWGTCPSNVNEDPYVPLTLKIADAPEGFRISGYTEFIVKIYGYPDQESTGVSWNETYNELHDTKHYPENTVLYIYPKDRTKPLKTFTVSTCKVKELVAWNESGHESEPNTPYQQSFKTKIYGPLVLTNSGDTLQKVPETLHPSIVSLYGIFHNAKKLVSFPNDWDTTNVVDMGGAFFNFKFPDNTDLSNWNTSNVTNMSGMFMNSTGYNVKLADFDVSKVTDMSYMFYGAIGYNKEDWSNWDVSNVTDMNHMFGNIYFNPNVSNWQTTSLTDMSYMFYKASQFNRPLNSWNTSKVTNMHSVFSGAREFNQPLNDWDVSNVTWFYNMFQNAEVFNQPLDKWNVVNGVSFRYMFYEAMAYNQDLTMWCTTNIDDDYYNRANFINTNMQTNWSNSLQPVWGTCPRGEDQEMYCVPDVVELSTATLTSTTADVAGLIYQIGDEEAVAITAELGDVELTASEILLAVAVKAGNRPFLELVMGTLALTETTLSSNPIAPLTYTTGGTIVFHRNTDEQVTLDLFTALFDTEEDTMSLTTCAFGTIKTVTLPVSELTVGMHIRSANVINRKNTIVYNKEDEFVGTLEQFLASEDIVLLVDSDTEIKVKHVSSSLSGYKIISVQTLENVPFYVLPETPVEEEDGSFKPMVISGNLSSVAIYSHSPLLIKYPAGTIEIKEQLITEGVTEPIYNYSADIGMPGLYGGRIQISHLDRVSPIKGLAMPYTGSYIEQWYSGGYEAFVTADMLTNGIRGMGNYITRVPDVPPPNTTNLSYLFAVASSFAQDLSKWCVTDITEMPANFMHHSYPNAMLPVWGTCPVVTPDTDKTSMILEVESSSIAIRSSTPLSIDWGPLATAEDDSDHYLEGSIHVYERGYVTSIYSVAPDRRLIRVIAEDGVSKIASFGISGISAIRQWYANGYDGFIQGGLSSVKFLPYDQPPKTTNYSNMFAMAYYAIAPNIETWDMSEATNLSYMFYSNAYFNADLSQWNVGNVSNMAWMFYGASAFISDLSQWCVGLITRKPTNFDMATSLTKAMLPVWGTCPRGEVEFPEPEVPTDPGGNIDPSGYIGDWMEIRVVRGYAMFTSTTELEVDWGEGTLHTEAESNESEYDGGTFTVYSYVAQYSEDMENVTVLIKVRPLSGSGPIENFVMEYVDTVGKWYKGGYSVHIYGDGFDLGNGSVYFGSMIQEVPPVAPPNTPCYTYMFAGSQFDGNITKWDTSNVTDMSYMFAENVSFSRDISGWNVANVTNMNAMFSYAMAFSHDLSQWCVANVTEEPESFGEESGLTSEQFPVWGTCPTAT